MSDVSAYVQTRARVADYFDRTATKTWERLTSDAPVSGVRATVRAGRDEMQRLILANLPNDLRGARVLDAGCGTGTLAVKLADRGADVLGVDISPSLVEIARNNAPDRIAGSLDFRSGDMFYPAFGQFDYAVAMDSMIYYNAGDIGSILGDFAPRLGSALIFTLPPRTALLMAMWRVGKLFPRSDRSPMMVPHTVCGIEAVTDGTISDLGCVNSGFYHSRALKFEGAA